MSNEREAFEAWCKLIGYCVLKDDDGRYKPGYGLELISPFQAGAAWQRTQAQPSDDAKDALVEGLETIALESTDEQARCCAHHYLAAYRAAQEKK